MADVPSDFDWSIEFGLQWVFFICLVLRLPWRVVFGSGLAKTGFELAKTGFELAKTGYELAKTGFELAKTAQMKKTIAFWLRMS